MGVTLTVTHAATSIQYSRVACEAGWDSSDHLSQVLGRCAGFWYHSSILCCRQPNGTEWILVSSTYMHYIFTCILLHRDVWKILASLMDEAAQIASAVACCQNVPIRADYLR